MREKIKALEEMFESYKYIEGTEDDLLMSGYLDRIKKRIDKEDKNGKGVVFYRNEYFKLEMRR